MNDTLLYALIFINLAMVLYSVGVWAERIRKRLMWWHLWCFWSGLMCDAIGTTAMAEIGGALFRFNLHGITGMTAILLMLFHATWATRVMIKKDEQRILSFHRFSIFVWIMWMIPMVGGMVLGARV